MVVLAVVFRTGRSSGKPLLLPVLKKTPPGPPKPPPGPPNPRIPKDFLRISKDFLRIPKDFLRISKDAVRNITKTKDLVKLIF